MIRVRVSGNTFDPIISLLDRMTHPDLTPLAADVRGIMIEDNRRGLLAGRDCFGDEMAPVEESTIRRGRGGDGPPLVPRGEASRAIADYDVEVQPGAERTLLIGGWRSTPFIHFHVTGFTVQSKGGPKAVVPRDPADLRPEAAEEIGGALADFARTLIGGGQ